jgi:hypothetical protein
VAPKKSKVEGQTFDIGHSTIKSVTEPVEVPDFIIYSYYFGTLFAINITNGDSNHRITASPNNQ